MQNYNQQQQAIILKGIAQQILSMNVPSFNEVDKMLSNFNYKIISNSLLNDTVNILSDNKKSQKCNSIILKDNIIGVFINQLPEDQRIPFNKWLIGQTITQIEDQPFAYACDYNLWYKSWIKNEIADIED